MQQNRIINPQLNLIKNTTYKKRTPINKGALQFFVHYIDLLSNQSIKLFKDLVKAVNS